MNDRRIARAMTREEARRACEAVKHRLEECRGLLLELYERRGWEALGYPSWRACCTAEFGLSQSRVYQLLDAARVERDVSTVVESLPAPLPERALRPLAQLESADTRREALGRALAESGGAAPTAAAVEAMVERARAALSPDVRAALVAEEEAIILRRGREIEEQEAREGELERGRRVVVRCRQALAGARRLGWGVAAAHLEEAMAEAEGKVRKMEARAAEK